MKLIDLCDIKTNMADADFWLYTTGSEKSLGTPTGDRENYENKIGIKLKKEAKDKLDLKYLFYLFQYLHSSQYWQRNGLVYGSTRLMGIRIQDVKNLEVNIY
jgi:hypothetical protein